MIAATLESVERLNSTTSTFWFKPSQSVDYTAGQFIEIFLTHDPDERGTHRWFTLSSSPSEPLIAITTRNVPSQSSFKRALFSLRQGETVQVSQAMGDFVLPMQKSIPIIFLVRGIGITPVRSMLKFLKDSGESRDITVIYSAKHAEDMLFSELINSVAADSINLEISSHTEVNLPVQEVLNRIKIAPNARIYISGPEQFSEIAYERLINQGVKASSIVADYFHGYTV